MTDPAIGQSLSDRYRIERELGRGGMATVYLARDLKHGRNVAIKVLHPEIASRIGRDRFLREIEITARLAHPHVLPLFDSGAVGDDLYYVMPFVAGGSLRSRLAAEPVLGLGEVLRLTREIASALGRAHEEGLVHRDVKPENVLLADSIAQMADFGIAHEDPAANVSTEAATREQTTLGVTLGTPLYMAPEQSAGEALDGRADQYALACVVFEMLAGRPPFTAPTARALAASHANDPVPPLASLHPGLPPGVEAVIARALSKHAADRYPTMAAFADALASAAAAGAGATAAPARDRIPHPRTRFVGREREVSACLAALEAGRLLTITGIGGSGKTRLAIELAGGLRERFRDGVGYVDLAPLKEAGRLSLTLAAALEIKDDGKTAPLDAVIARMRDRDALIVLDNCEHVIEAASEAVDALLGASERLKLIVTSREGLGIEGERTFTLRSLAMPAAGADVAELERSEAVQLFLDRARDVAPEFTLDAETAPAVSEICRRLDGIPLALELAAARLRVLRASEIAARLDDRFRLLTGGSRTALPRHQTLQAAVQWSYDLLDDDERRVLRHAAVFAGGWTLGAITQVMGEDADEFELIERMDRLVDKSLVVAQPEAAGMRYAMLETVRQFAMDRLSEAGESVAARQRHLEHFVTMAERAASAQSGPKHATWIARMTADRENLLAAHEWAGHDPANAELGLRLASALHPYWYAVASPGVGRRTLAEALERPGAASPTPARARALYAAGSMAYFNNDAERTRRYAEECLALTRTLGDDDLRIDALMVCGMAAFAQGDQPATLEYLRQQVELARSRGDEVRLARALGALGDVVRFHGDLAASQAMYLEARSIAERRNDAAAQMVQTSNLGLVALGRGDEPAARRLLREAMALVATGRARLRSILMDNAAGLAALREDWTRVARCRGAVAAEHERQETNREREDEATLEPLVERAREALGAESFERAYADGQALEMPQALAEIDAWLTAIERG